MMQKAEVAGAADETANPRGCKLEVGIYEQSGIARFVLETLSRMPSLQESERTIPHTVWCRESLQEQKGAYGPHSHYN